jgi:hypothetical protein
MADKPQDVIYSDWKGYMLFKRGEVLLLSLPLVYVGVGLTAFSDLANGESLPFRRRGDRQPRLRAHRDDLAEIIRMIEAADSLRLPG